MAFSKNNKLSKKYSDELISEVMQKYVDGKNSKELSVEYGLNQGTITMWLRKNNLSRTRGPKSKIEIENYFETINTERKAYWLGYLMADGCCHEYNNQYHIKLGCSIKDRFFIDEFLKDIKSSNTPREIKSGNGAIVVSLSSLKMYNDLKSHGVSINKSGNEYIPSTVPEELVNHFIRGFFDGDGSTHLSGTSSFCCTISMASEISNKIGIPFRIQEFKSTNKVIDAIASKKNDSKKMYFYMYKNATIYLNRKYKRFENIFGPIL